MERNLKKFINLYFSYDFARLADAMKFIQYKKSKK